MQLIQFVWHHPHVTMHCIFFSETGSLWQPSYPPTHSLIQGAVARESIEACAALRDHNIFSRPPILVRAFLNSCR